MGTRRTVEQINKTRSSFFERINKIDQPLTRLIKNKRKKIQINKITNEKGETTTNTKKIQMSWKTYYEQLYANKLGNLEDMDAFLESHKLPKLEQEENRKPEQANNQGGNWSSHQKPPKAQKSRARWLPRGILSNI